MRGVPYHTQTQGNIERWHQTLKNRILLENYYFPGDLDRQIGAFVEHDLPLNFHPVAIRVSADVTPFGAG